MQFSDAEEIARYLGFTVLADVQGLSNINHLFTDDLLQTKKHPYSGVYMKIEENNFIYIGKSNDVRRRYKQHLETPGVMKFFAFRLYPERQIDEMEKTFISRAKEIRLPLINVLANRGTVNTDKPFDDIFSPEDQDLFIENIAAGQTFLNRWRSAFGRAEPRERNEWNLFSRMTSNPEGLIRIAKTYIETVVPSPIDTLGSYCLCTLPHIGRAQPVIQTINIRTGINSVFELYYHRRASKQHFVKMLIDPHYLRACFKTEKDIYETFPWARIELPPPEAEPSIDERLNHNKELRRRVFKSPQEKTDYVSRAVTQVDATKLGSIVIPVDAFTETLENPFIACSATIAVIAGMRYTEPISNDHNKLLMYRLCPETMI